MKIKNINLSHLRGEAHLQLHSLVGINSTVGAAAMTAAAMTGSSDGSGDGSGGG
jgi:hypothetical protein